MTTRRTHRELIPYTPDTWTPDQRQAHEAANLESAFHAASCLAGGWYRRAVAIDVQVTEGLDERYMLRPVEVPVLDGWHACYEVKRVGEHE